MDERQCKLLFAGDVYGGQEEISSVVGFDLQKILQNHDMRVCNFEAPITKERNGITKAGPLLYQHANCAAALVKDGFNCFVLANNHIFDYGREGLSVTLDALEGMLVVGAGLSSQTAYEPIVIELNGIRVGIIALAEAYSGFVVPGDGNAGFAWLHAPGVDRLVRKTKAQVDFLVVQVHAGLEDVPLPPPELRARLKELISWGADAIIGHHPHVPQGWEVFQGKPIFYSLGNFFFNSPSGHPLWNRGYAVSLSCTADQKLTYKVLPTITVNGRVELDASDQSYNYLEELCQLLHRDDYDEMCTQQALELWQEPYQRYYLEAMNGITSITSARLLWRLLRRRALHPQKLGINYPLLLHNIQIESHRWTVERALQSLVEKK